MGLFGKRNAYLAKQVRKLQNKMRREMQGLERQINEIKREEEKVASKVRLEIKEYANDKNACIVLAKALHTSGKAVCRLHTCQTEINSVINEMDHQLRMLRVNGAMQQSTDVMKNMQHLVKTPQIMKIMRKLSKEMTKAGIIGEVIKESMETLEPEEPEEDSKEAIERILYETTAGQIGKLPNAVPVSLKRKE